MRLLLIRSIPISVESKRAWRKAGALFMRRDRVMDTLPRLPFDVILNLGDSSFREMDDVSGKWWNVGDNIRMIRSPSAMRSNFGDLMPELPALDDSNWWLKSYGRAGTGNTHYTNFTYGDLISDGELAGGVDAQVHIDGYEYRVTTVGDRIVQQHVRTGVDPDRSYQWINADSLPKGVRPMVKEAAARIPGHNVVSWDTIVSDKPYILEGNSSPGINVATAQRVVKEITRQREEANA